MVGWIFECRFAHSRVRSGDLGFGIGGFRLEPCVDQFFGRRGEEDELRWLHLSSNTVRVELILG